MSTCKHENVVYAGKVNIWRCTTCGHEEPETENLRATVVLLKSAMQKFCDRVEAGEVRSTKTYLLFKSLLLATPIEAKGILDKVKSALEFYHEPTVIGDEGEVAAEALEELKKVMP